jgi:hypothetical protein
LSDRFQFVVIVEEILEKLKRDVQVAVAAVTSMLLDGFATAAERILVDLKNSLVTFLKLNGNVTKFVH